MMKKQACVVENIDLRRFILEFAQRQGRIKYSLDYGLEFDAYYIDEDDYVSGTSKNKVRKHNDYDELTINDFMNLISQPIIMIGCHKVIFGVDGIKVGCQIVSKDIVKQIYDRLFQSK